MAVESSDSKLREKTDGDVNRKVKGALQAKYDAVKPELENISKLLNTHRAIRDTTNLPSVEMASSNRKGAISRRMQKNGKDKKITSQVKNPITSDSGTSDDANADIAGSGGDAAS